MFHVKITDLETGEVEVDADTGCIIMGFESGEGQCDGLQLTDCPASTILATADAAIKIAKKAAEFVANRVLGLGGDEDA